MIDPSELTYNENGLIPAIVQSESSRRVLMFAFMSEESLRLTIDKGETVFFSRSRGSLWHKGETSGNTQKVVLISKDCDGDSLLVVVSEKGPACHTGSHSCFDNHDVKGRDYE